MPRPATRTRTYDARGSSSAPRAALAAPVGDAQGVRTAGPGSLPPGPTRTRRPAVPRCGAPQPGGGAGPRRHGKGVRRHGTEGQPVPESGSRPAVAMISRRRLNRARRACAANRHRRVPGLGEESDRPEGIGRAPCTDRTCPECGTAGRTRARCGAHSDLTRGRARGPGANDRAARHWGPPSGGLSTKGQVTTSVGCKPPFSPKRFFVQVSIGPGRVYIYITGRNPANRYDVFGIARSLACIDLQMHPLA